jgi:hypothetical protein
MSRALLRTAILVYATLLALGAWPFPDTPFIGAVGAHARAVLAKASIEPGESVFAGVINDLGLVSDCIEIDGREGFGLWRPLYRGDCPPELPHDALHQLHRYHVRHGSFAPLLHPGTQLPRQPGEMLRRFVALGDYYCHSELIEGPRRSQVRLGLHQSARHLHTGALLFTGIDCVWRCKAEALAVPECRRREQKVVSPGFTEGALW